VNTEAPLLPGFPLRLIFSGFDAKYRLQLHETIFDIVWFGEGRWNWTDIYNMPIFLRRYWIKRINGIVKDREAAVKQQQQKSNKSKLPTKRRP
tara:strand:- start:133 stop:411 length:279 start_codon:yes stop_codon:yes gene_type:complete